MTILHRRARLFLRFAVAAAGCCLHSSGALKTNLFAVLVIGLGLSSAAPAQTPPTLSREARELIQGSLADFDAKKYDDALVKLRDAEKKLPDDPFVLNLIGAAYTKKKDFQTAQTYFDRSLEKQPDFFPAKFNVGELFFLQRQYQESYDYFSKMLQTDPRNELLQFKVFLSLLQLNQTDEAAKSLARIKYPGDTPAWYYAQAAWESKKGNKKKAAEYVTGARYIFGPKTAMFDETFEDLGIQLR